MIQTIVDDCLRDGQFDDCDLTMRDLAIIVDALEHTVTTVFHHRIDYPGFDFNRERARRRASETGARLGGRRPARGMNGSTCRAGVSGAPPPARVRSSLARASRATRSRRRRGLRALLRRRPDARGSTGAIGARTGRPTSSPFRRARADTGLSRRHRHLGALRRPGGAAPGSDSRAREIDRLLLHGFLHLMGYDHETDDGEMEALERRLRRRLGIADPAAPAPGAAAMIALLSAGFCYLAFLLFETFALALDRLSPIKVRGLLEEHPERARILSGAGEVEIVRTTTKVVVQALLLAGLLTTVSGFTSFGVPRPWLWGGLFFVSGWLLTEIGLLRRDANRDPEKIVARLLPVITAASWLLLPIAFLIRRIFAGRAPAPEKPPEATEQEVRAYIDVGRQEGILEKEEEKLLLSIVDFGDTRVREVMTPRTDVVWIDVAVVADGPLRPLRRVEVLAHPGRARIDRHGRRRSSTSRTRSRRSARAPTGPIAELMREAVLRSGDQEGLRAAARVPAPPPLDGDRRGRVRRRLGRRHRRGPPRGDRRRDLRRARGRARAGLEGGGERLLGLGQGQHRGRAGPLRTGARGRRVLDGRPASSRAAWATSPSPGETHRESDLRFTVEEADRRRVYRVRIEPVASPPAARRRLRRRGTAASSVRLKSDR